MRRHSFFSTFAQIIEIQILKLSAIFPFFFSFFFLQFNEAYLSEMIE